MRGEARAPREMPNVESEALIITRPVGEESEAAPAAFAIFLRRAIPSPSSPDNAPSRGESSSPETIRLNCIGRRLKAGQKLSEKSYGESSSSDNGVKSRLLSAAARASLKSLKPTAYLASNIVITR